MKRKIRIVALLAIICTVFIATPVYAGTSYAGPNATGHVYVHYHDGNCYTSTPVSYPFAGYYGYTGRGSTGYQYVFPCGHSVDVPPNYQNQWQYHTCTITTLTCGYSNGASWVASYHTWGDPEVITAPTCLENGLGHHSCTSCGYETDYTMSALGHDWVRQDNPIEPTLDQTGVARWVCSRCNLVYEGVIPRRRLTSVFNSSATILAVVPGPNQKHFTHVMLDGYDLSVPTGDATDPQPFDEERILLHD